MYQSIIAIAIVFMLYGTIKMIIKSFGKSALQISKGVQDSATKFRAESAKSLDKTLLDYSKYLKSMDPEDRKDIEEMRKMFSENED